MRSALPTLILVLVLALTTLYTFRLHDSPGLGIDDANIFFSYAENLAAGNGVRYGHNLENVEGFTSALWMLLCAFSFLAGMDETGVFALAFGVLITTHIITLRAIAAHAKDKSTHPLPFQLLYIALIASSPSYITWMTITLMDTCLWGFVLAAMVYSIIRPPITTTGWFVRALPFFAAPLTRPEGLLVAPVLLCFFWLRTRQKFPALANQYGLRIGSALAATVLGLTVFRLLYFGYPLPNTYYAKVSPSLLYNVSEGSTYLFQFLSDSGLLFLCGLIIITGSIYWLGRCIDDCLSAKSLYPLIHTPLSAGFAVALITFVLLGIPVLTGGDHFYLYRLYQPVFPLLCLAPLLLAIEVLPSVRNAPLMPRLKPPFFAGVLSSVAGMYCLFTFGNTTTWQSFEKWTPLSWDFELAAIGKEKGERLADIFENFGSYPSIGVLAAGGIARTYPGEIIDLMGLNNVTFAHWPGKREGQKNHAAFERTPFYLLAPDIILASPPIPPDTSNFQSTALKGLFDDARFVDQWRYGAVSTTHNAWPSFEGFVAKSLIKKIKASDNLNFQETMIWTGIWEPVPALQCKMPGATDSARRHKQNTTDSNKYL